MDIVLVGFIAGYVYGGWRTGFLRRLLGLVFTVIALVAGAYIRYPLGAIAGKVLGNVPSDYADLVGYAIAFPAILAGLHVASSFVLGRVGTRGVARGLDAALGAVFGGVEAIVVLSAAVVILDAYFGTISAFGAEVAPGILKEFTAGFNASETVKLLRGSTVPIVLALMSPFLPRDVTQLLPGGLPGRLPFPSNLP
jgi:uncharacterized membrane protein required for colicin V production